MYAGGYRVECCRAINTYTQQVEVNAKVLVLGLGLGLRCVPILSYFYFENPVSRRDHMIFGLPFGVSLDVARGLVVMDHSSSLGSMVRRAGYGLLFYFILFFETLGLDTFLCCPTFTCAVGVDSYIWFW